MQELSFIQTKTTTAQTPENENTSCPKQTKNGRTKQFRAQKREGNYFCTFYAPQPLQMQTIIRGNSENGTDPETGGNADRKIVETAFVRMPLHQQYYQVYVGIDWHTKVSKNFFVDCNMCLGFGYCQHMIYSGLQTVIFLNCTFNFNDVPVNHNGANPQIHIETIDDSCKQFTAAEKAAGRSVTELTVKVLCEQLKLIKIPETEKMELINGFIQRRAVQNEEVLGALCASGFDCSDFVLKKGITSDQLITSMNNQGSTTDQILLILAKSKLDISTFAEKKGISNDQILIILAKNNVDISDFAQKKGMTNEQVLIALIKNQIDYKIFSFSKSISDDHVLVALEKSGADIQDFQEKKNISNDQALIILAKNNIDITTFTQRKKLSNDQVLITLAQNGIDVSSFTKNKSMSHNYVLQLLMKHNIDYSQYTQTNLISNDIILVALMNSELDYQRFIQTNNITSTQIINAASQSELSLQQKQQLLSNYTDYKLDIKDINNALIKREYELVNERVIQFINNQQNKIAIDLAFSQVMLQHERNGNQEYIQELKVKIQELQNTNEEQKKDYELKLSEQQQQYDADLIKCKNDVETLRKEYQQDLQKEYDKYKNEIEELKNTYEEDKKNSEIMKNLQQNKHIIDQQQEEINENDTILNQLKLECQILQQQLTDEKQYHDDQYELAQLSLKRSIQRNVEIQKQLLDEKKQRITFFEKLEKKQSEITKQLESNMKEQASRIVHLENENQSLQSTLNALREQIEKLNVQEYQKRIEMQTKQLEDKEEYIEKLKEEIEKINVNQLQDKQIEKVLTILKNVNVSQ
ncbi:Hypothetical_protein [Hexamita inflata]|uniref:Hypothetical_protein n=1 Tax=Hexamita inflata TaxID=28002 RepID=A0AA86NK23_9EUKA|nr:Hypothetical protein HINF_LOCUS8890 [Hexamita inflata]